jgi:RNA polymerase sigma-70 factor (ECF subfamily)
MGAESMTVTAGNPISGYGLDRFDAEALPHMNDLFRTAARLLLDRTKASDAVQETYLIAWRTFDRYQAGTNCRAWLHGILFNVIRQQRRKWFKWMVGVEGDRADLPLRAPEPIASRITDGEILVALDHLSIQFREVLLLVDVDEFSYKEASEILRVPIGTVMSRVSRARAILRSQLAEAARSYGIPNKSFDRQ